VQRPAPGGGEGGDRREIREVQVGDVDGRVAVVATMSAAVRAPAWDVADGERDRGPGGRQDASGLDADARRAARDDRAPPVRSMPAATSRRSSASRTAS